MEAAGRTTRSPFLTYEDLEARWGLKRTAVKSTLRRWRVPVVWLSAQEPRVRVEDVERAEQAATTQSPSTNPQVIGALRRVGRRRW